MVQALIDTFEVQIKTVVVCLLSILVFEIFSVDYANFTHASKNANTPSSNIGSSPTQKPDLSFVAAGSN